MDAQDTQQRECATQIASVWKCTVQDAEMGEVLFWAVTKKEALSLAKAYIEDDAEKRYIQSSRRLFVELSPEGLVRWLNIHFVYDNG